jgi:cob(I)alamin adenosyltransferase
MPKLDKGYLHVYTGDGKGKTTASLGLALRALGFGMRVYLMHFTKGTATSEHKALERFGDQISIGQCGSAGFITGAPTDNDRAEARRGLRGAAAAMAGGEYGLVILDELNCALDLALVSVDEALDAIARRAAHVEVVVTGRNAPRALLERADLVTEMKMLKHYYAAGVGARAGIEK